MRSRFKNNLSVQFIVVLGLVMVASMFFKYASEVYRDYKVNQEIETLRQGIQDLERENIELALYLKYLDTDSYKEIIAKRDLNLQRPGEEVIIIKREKEEDERKEQEIKSYSLLPIYMKWWNLFMGES